MNQYQTEARKVKRIIAEGRNAMESFGKEYLKSVQQLLEKNKDGRIKNIKRGTKEG